MQREWPLLLGELLECCPGNASTGSPLFLILPLMCLLFVFSLASDYGMKLPILRSTPEDQILYQTERYNEETFGYEVPVKEEGDYVLVLKFAEVYFAQSQQKVRGVEVPVWPVAHCCF
jgi:hypothetical protein